MIKYELELKTEDLNVVDKIVQKMLEALTHEELELIGECKTSKTLMEVIRDPKAAPGSLNVP